MLVGGLQKYTLIDFPGRVACVLFTQGCNMRCPFCHNESLWPMEGNGQLSEDDFFLFLQNRIGKLDGAVISGGEPTLQPDLAEVFKKIHGLGFATKLDTNGTRPDVLERLIGEGLVDFVAMDLKHRLDEYSVACGTHVDLSSIKKSLALLKSSSLHYELRTTAIPAIHSMDHLKSLSAIVAGAPRFTLQNFSPKNAAAPWLRQTKPFQLSQLEQLRPIFEPIVGKFTIR
ncbi:MAG: anaerobic ribonucleoside-triphosphate reductase activating protein [Puniceicoccales bacterium]|jgi:pyruvate formate lyase activating enzyme|nr:anaerobic ribonucleoside-triphosphate reductase activating protein [Puniceicoccales bacterium]